MRRIISLPSEHPSGWDEAKMRFFVARPPDVMLQVRVTNELVKQCNARSKPERAAAKIEILNALSRLILKTAVDRR